MQQSQVDILLESYKQNIGRRGHIVAEIGRVEREIAAIESGAADIKASVLTGMPRSGALRDDTAQKAMLLAEGTLRETKALTETLKRLRSELARAELEITYVENWLKALSEREKCVINLYVIDGNTWQYVVESFAKIFGLKASITTLRRIKTMALEKIYAMAA